MTATAAATLDRPTIQKAAPKPVAQPTEKSLRAKAKNAAAQFLERRGYDILNRDWKCNAGACVDFAGCDSFPKT